VTQLVHCHAKQTPLEKRLERLRNDFDNSVLLGTTRRILEGIV